MVHIGKGEAMKRINQLDGLRFIFCVIIIISHFEFLTNSSHFGTIYTLLKNPTMGVDYFFILSGFGLFMSCSNIPAKLSMKNCILYAVNRIKKIYPIYFISLLLGLSYVFVTIDLGNAFKRILGYSGLFCVDSLLIQSLSGNITISHSINGVAWFLSCLFICYMMCPVFLKGVSKIKSKKNAGMLLVAVVLLILGMSEVCMLVEKITNYQIFNDLWYGHPIIRCWYILIGMLVAFIYQHTSYTIDNRVGTSVFILAILYYFLRSQLDIPIFAVRFFDISICIAIVFVVTMCTGVIVKVFSSKRMVSLGNDSLYFYLLHYPFRITIDTLFRRFNIIQRIGEVGYVIEVIVIVVATYGTTTLLKRNKKKLDTMFSPLFQKIS